MEMMGMDVTYCVGSVEKCPEAASVSSSTSKTRHLDIPTWQGFPRNASEGQLNALKEAGNFLKITFNLIKLLFNYLT